MTSERRLSDQAAASGEPHVSPPEGDVESPSTHQAEAAAAYAAAASHTHAETAVVDVEAGAQETAIPVLGDIVESEVVEPVSELDELVLLAAKAEEYLQLAQRMRADFENYKKRANREMALAQERGVAKLAKELLPAIDHLELAVQALGSPAPAAETESEGQDESQLASGIRLVQADVLAALARLGIESFSPEGEPFDPQHHEAVAQAPIEGVQSGTVVEVYQRGYRLGETVLRPARVVVAA
jgi:molecular chaperone GrpE